MIGFRLCAPTCPHSAGTCAGKFVRKSGLCGQCGHFAHTCMRGTTATVRAHVRARKTYAAQAAQPAQANAIRHLRAALPAQLPAPAPRTPHWRGRARAQVLSCPVLEKKREGARHG